MIIANVFSFAVLSRSSPCADGQPALGVHTRNAARDRQGDLRPAQTAYLPRPAGGRAADGQRANFVVNGLDGDRRGGRWVRDLPVRGRDRAGSSTRSPSIAAVVISTSAGGPDPDEGREVDRDVQGHLRWMGIHTPEAQISRIVIAKGMWAMGGGADLPADTDRDGVRLRRHIHGCRGHRVLYMARLRERVRPARDSPADDRPEGHALHHRDVPGAGALRRRVATRMGVLTLVLVFFSHGCSGYHGCSAPRSSSAGPTMIDGQGGWH